MSVKVILPSSRDHDLTERPFSAAAHGSTILLASLPAGRTKLPAGRTNLPAGRTIHSSTPSIPTTRASDFASNPAWFGPGTQFAHPDSMSRPLRFIPPGSMVEVTTRVMQGRFLLVPSDDLKEIVLGVLGRALTMYAVQLHAFIFLSNHYELLLSVPDAVVLAGFMNFVNSNLAREIGRMHGWREKIWGRRYRSIPIVDEESQVARLRYLLSNGCKEGLVASPREWPGASSLPALLDGQPLHRVWFDRSAEYRARKRGEQPTKYAHASRYDVPLTPLPCWANLSIEEHRRHCAELVADIEAETRLARAASGRPPLGVNALQQQHPHARPARLSHSPAPWCHASCKEHRHRFKDAYAGFVRAFRQATRVLRDLVPRIEFPPHCFPPMLAFVGSGRS